ncbi:MAG: hypothetical protein E5Y65_25215 [Mesorhizobium sp.]|nr:MAG: hypothetical protein E5Y65_25215 [Mesorhizobium sp.]TIL98490.1 MAG: hypothetical protein E5Y64_26050 [Mesorhizobium sp.]TIM22703.1 MAG: hypothetical protein E5Y61_30360 [Mesorhizobium sp.]
MWNIKRTNRADCQGAWRAGGGQSLQVCAAPHRPAGHFSPYRDGEKGAVAQDFANLRRCRKGCRRCGQPLRPSLYTGRRCRQRGSADVPQPPAYAACRDQRRWP